MIVWSWRLFDWCRNWTSTTSQALVARWRAIIERPFLKLPWYFVVPFSANSLRTSKANFVYFYTILRVFPQSFILVDFEDLHGFSSTPGTLFAFRSFIFAWIHSFFYGITNQSLGGVSDWLRRSANFNPYFLLTFSFPIMMLTSFCRAYLFLILF